MYYKKLIDFVLINFIVDNKNITNMIVYKSNMLSVKINKQLRLFVNITFNKTFPRNLKHYKLVWYKDN